MTYYDIFTIDGNSIKVDTASVYYSLVTYFKSSDLSGIEILLNKNLDQEKNIEIHTIEFVEVKELLQVLI